MAVSDPLIIARRTHPILHWLSEPMQGPPEIRKKDCSPVTPEVQFLDEAPAGVEVTPYDEGHLAVYLRLLDAEADGATWQDAARIIFGLDPDSCAHRAEGMHRTHLARAHWMRDEGYKQLAERYPKRP